MTDTPESKLLVDDTGEKVAIVGDCVVVLIRPKLTLRGVTAIEGAFDQIAERDAWIAYLAVIVPDVKSFDSEAQRRLSNAVGKHTDHTSGAAIVYEGTGFRATTVRSVLTAIHWASRAKHPLKVFATVGSALSWLKQQPRQQEFNVAAVGQVLRSMTRR